MLAARAKEDALIALVEGIVDDLNAVITDVERESGMGICEKAQWMTYSLAKIEKTYTVDKFDLIFSPSTYSVQLSC